MLLDETNTAVRRLAEFVCENRERDLPDDVLRESRRLLLNGLAASIAARDHPAVKIVRRWSEGRTVVGSATRLLWEGTRVAPEHATLVNAFQMEVLDFNESHPEAFVHPTAPVAPAALAEAERLGCSGKELLVAVALGIEVELAVATILMPSHYARGFNPGALAGAVGSAAACAALSKLDNKRAANALGLAMLSCAEPLEALGSSAHAYAIGSAARAGLIACELATLGLESPPAALEGRNGVISAYSDEANDKATDVIMGLGRNWRLLGNAYKRYPTETITHAPLEGVLALRSRCTAERSREVETLRLEVAPLVAEVAAGRYRRFGRPKNDLEARFDLRFCVAAAWVRGQFTGAEVTEDAFSDARILDLRDRVEVTAGEARAMDGSGLEVVYADGSNERYDVEAFRGSPSNPLSDHEIADKFETAAGDSLSPAQVTTIIATIRGIDECSDLGQLLELIAPDLPPGKSIGPAQHQREAR